MIVVIVIGMSLAYLLLDNLIDAWGDRGTHQHDKDTDND